MSGLLLVSTPKRQRTEARGLLGISGFKSQRDFLVHS